MTTTLDILDKLIGFDTVSRNSNMDLALFAEAHLKERGFTVQRIKDPDADKMGLYAEIGPGGDGVVLSAHTDVVPVDGQSWTRDPFRLTRDGDRVYGRGATDMKGYVASVLALADRAAKSNLREPLKIVLSYDEETGCVGIQRMLDRLAPMIGTPRACFVGEPTSMRVATGHKGKAALRATCHGQPGHSALAPQFANALYMAADFIIGLRDLQAAYARNGNRDPGFDVPYTTFHVGQISGGTALNIVPDRAGLIFEYRHLEADKASLISQQIHAAANRAAVPFRDRYPDARIEVEIYNAYPGLDVSPTEAVVLYAQKLAQSTGTIKVSFGTEGGYFGKLGIPTIVCGPGSMEGQGHQPDEYLELEQLANCDAMMGRLLKDLSY